MTNEQHEREIDQQLEEIRTRAGDLIEPCKFASSFAAYGEIRRLARGNQRVVHYIEAVFFQMDQAQYLLDFETMRERSVELVSLLESEERARRIQPDFPDEVYEYLVGSMSACAYENLAEATGQLEGYNSEGMHACIADGIQVCRQTGKLACISCFREYSVDVYTAADDIEIARYQCQQIIDHPGPWSDRGDRRWLAATKAAWLELLGGHGRPAWELALSAYALCQEESVSVTTEAKIRSLFSLLTIGAVTGQDCEAYRAELASLMPPAGEAPEFEYQSTLIQALWAAVQGRMPEAIEQLTRLDDDLSRRKREPIGSKSACG